ncbi:MAG: lysoplasmalogenase [Saccharospirillaceae bacterium]|nr:lysoplasmalogenase [Saccharospirillaceae bacterium]MCD8531179.1 lysoplasmalogenase [Saccharospirillaceae bacterium]
MSRRLFVLAAVLGGLYILLWPLHPYPFSYALKASPVVLLAVVAWWQCKHGHLGLRAAWLYALAMLTSAAGDVFLDVDRSLFLTQALAAFLLAQLSYIALLWPVRQSRRGDVFRAGMPALFAVVLLWQFYPNTGALWWPVLVYVLCLWGMAVLAWRSANRWVAAGGMLFMLADSLIGVNRFWLPFEHSTPVIVSLYISAQLLLGYGLLLATDSPLLKAATDGQKSTAESAPASGNR